MAIDIYDKASIVKKDDRYYYFVKNGSKNCFTCPFQTIVDNNFRNKFMKRQSRESNWKIIAVGNTDDVKNDKIALTDWNAPLFWYYGLVRFGDKTNIALYFVKNKNKILDYNLLDEIQKANIDNNIRHYIDELKMQYTIDLSNIQEKDKIQEKASYCGTEYNLTDYSKQFNNLLFWNCNHL